MRITIITALLLLFGTRPLYSQNVLDKQLTVDFRQQRLDKALETARRTVSRRNMDLNETDREILTHIFNITAVNTVNR